MKRVVHLGAFAAAVFTAVAVAEIFRSDKGDQCQRTYARLVRCTLLKRGGIVTDFFILVRSSKYENARS